jgi:hypothetical protein
MKAPIEMPTMYVAQQQFEPQRVDFGAPEASGRLGGVQAGSTLWSGVWTLGRMPEANSDEWRAFLRTIRGATRRFIGRDLARQYPKLYPDGFGAFGAFTGAASTWSESINSDGDSAVTLHLGAAAAGLVLSVGDYIDFRYSASETAIVTVGATANGSGDVTVTVEPPIPAAVPSDAIAHIDQPGVTMVLDLQSSNVGPVDRLYSINGGQIVGVQDIRS